MFRAYITKTFHDYPVHVMCIAIFPVLALYAHNFVKTPWSHILLPTLFALAGAQLTWMMFALFTKRFYTGALLTSLGTILFFSYGHVFVSIYPLLRHRAMLAIWAFIFVAGGLLLYRYRAFEKRSTYAMNTVAVILIILPIATIIFSISKSFLVEEPQEDYIATFDYGSTNTDKDLPDIYYIVPDAMSSPAHLREYYNVDVDESIQEFEEMGFVVVPESTSNYSQTLFSLSSTLNLEYLDAFIPNGATNPSGEHIKNNRIIHFMNDAGYTTYFLGSWWTPTLSNPYADVNINYLPLDSEFTSILFATTMADPISKEFDLINPRRAQWIRVAFQLRKLKEVARQPGSKFVIVHIDTPHSPYIFDENGRYVRKREVEKIGNRVAYGRQASYMMDQLVAVSREILRISEKPPIIVIQSDHGGGTTGDESFVDGDNPVLTAKDHMWNFSALLFPDHSDAIPNDLTPVNTFRLVLQEYFGSSLPLLPNHNYFRAPGISHFIDVTDQIFY